MMLISLLGAINSVAVSADGRYIVSGSEDKSVKVFDMHTKEEVHHFVHAHIRINLLF